MTIQVTCRCGNAWNVNDSRAGMKVQCPECGGVVRAPAAADDEEPNEEYEVEVEEAENDTEADDEEPDGETAEAPRRGKRGGARRAAAEAEEPQGSRPGQKTPLIIGGAFVAVAAVLFIIMAAGGGSGPAGTAAKPAGQRERSRKREPRAAPKLALAPPVEKPAAKAKDEAPADNLRWTIPDFPPFGSTGHVKLVVVPNVDSVFMLTSYASAATDRPPSLFLRATTNATDLRGLMRKTMSTDLFVRTEGGNLMTTQPGVNTVELHITQVDADTISGVFSGSLHNVDFGTATKIEGDFNVPLPTDHQ